MYGCIAIIVFILNMNTGKYKEKQNIQREIIFRSLYF